MSSKGKSKRKAVIESKSLPAKKVKGVRTLPRGGDAAWNPRVEWDDLTELEKALVQAARKIRKRAYAPYSGYKVGAATADASGGIHVGANMEAIDYTSTIHAEQHAMNVLRLATDESAVALAFCVVSSAPTTHIAPCGLCRQRIREFAHNVHIPIIACNLAGDEGEIVSLDRYTLDEILPFSFGPDDSSDFTALPQRPAISPVKPFRPSKK